jgi:hypothetical protein
MSQTLVSHNDDLRRLVAKGYAVGFDSNYLIVRDIPYLNSAGDIQWGAIVAKLVHVTPERVQQDDHQILFAGGVPHGLDGKPVPNLGGGTHTLALSEAARDVVVERSFSNKRKVNGAMVAYDDFFDKIHSYVGLIASPAMQRGANPYTFRVVQSGPSDSVFKFVDTLTSRAEITDLAAKFKDEVVAVIGLGGTGAYVLDYLVKTPVREIRAYDGDNFHIHTAYRAPGRVDPTEFGTKKADVYRNRYDNFREGFSIEAKYVDRSTAKDFDGVTFAFVCVDKGGARAEIVDLLLAKRIPFIDVGMGLHRREERLAGMMRITYFSPEDGTRVRDLGIVELQDTLDDIYRTGIQIAELNALNAALAVIRYKQMCGFYFEKQAYYHLLFDVTDLTIDGRTRLDANQ